MVRVFAVRVVHVLQLYILLCFLQSTMRVKVFTPSLCLQDVRLLSENTHAGDVVMLNSVQPENGNVEPNHCDTVACRRLSCILALTKAPTLHTAVVCLQGRCVSKHKALSALLTAGR